VRVSLRSVSAPLRGPLAAAHGTVSRRELLLLALHDPLSGLSGYGEAAPLPSYDGVSVEQVSDAIADCRESLQGADLPTVLAPDTRAALLAACERRAVLTQALAAVDLALWDLAGRGAAEPVWRLLGAAAPAPIEVNWTVAATDRAGAAREVDRALRAGFATVKLKVAIGDDAGRVAAARAAAAGRSLALRLDANGGWQSEAEAQRWLEALAPAGIECCEEPVHGAEAIGRVAAAVPVAVALDESARDPVALQRRCGTAICLKISRCGGIAGLLRDAARARERGYQVYLASTYDGPLGIAAAVHAAAAIAPDRACGLATLPLFAARPDPLPASGGLIPAPVGAGLGDGLLSWYDG
jgi:L-alanine-DL-glutamate epimerase-like enolase superfamily enzyme